MDNRIDKYCFKDKFSSLLGGNLVPFMVLCALMIFRAPEDFFTPYLWAEDGTVLISGAVFNGISGLFIPGNGAYWFIQRALTLLLYWMVYPWNSILALPYFMQTAAKIIAVLSVMYFMSSRFEWIVQDKNKRFFICAALILLMPYQSIDVLTCDTALPFQLLFPIFLIGLDSLCAGRKEMLNWKQILLFSLFNLSSAAFVFPTAITGLAGINWLYWSIKEKKMKKRDLMINIIKVLMVFAAMSVQMSLVLSSGRVSLELALADRIVFCITHFIFIPYLLQLNVKGAFLIGMFVWAVLIYLARPGWKTVLYSVGFSYLYMLYCSFATDLESFQLIIKDMMALRYSFVCYEISVLFLGITVVRLLNMKTIYIRTAAVCMIAAVCITALRTYNITVCGPQTADCFKMSAVVYDNDGQDRVFIPVGPFEPWMMEIPSDISEYEKKDDIACRIELVNDVCVDEGETFQNVYGIDNMITLSGWVKTGTDNELLHNMYIKLNDSSYYAVDGLEQRDLFDTVELEHNGFQFTVPAEHIGLQSGVNTFELVGQTADGRWHSGRYTCTINSAEQSSKEL